MIRSAFRWGWDLILTWVTPKSVRELDLEAKERLIREDESFEVLWFDAT